jgi:hypothetical protein
MVPIVYTRLCTHTHDFPDPNNLFVTLLVKNMRGVFFVKVDGVFCRQQ